MELIEGELFEGGELIKGELFEAGELIKVARHSLLKTCFPRVPKNAITVRSSKHV